MATNSILHNVVIDSVDKAESFLDALEQSKEEFIRKSEIQEKIGRRFLLDCKQTSMGMEDYSANQALSECLHDIEGTEPVDAVEVVRCKDCKYKVIAENGSQYCSHYKKGVLSAPIPVYDNDFCSRGKRREDK